MTSQQENIETIEVETRRIACDGGGDMGHPAIYLEMGERSEVVCPYCSRTFVLKDGAAPAAGH